MADDLPLQLRQGDVLLIATPDAEPAEGAVEQPRERGALVLARGELTGHAHAVHGEGARLLAAPGALDALLIVERPAVLRHEEHGPIELPVGRYLVRRQREYAYDQWRLVGD